MNFHTADICDEYREEIKVLPPLFRNYGGVTRCAGPIRTIRLERNNADLIAVLSEPGLGAVAVVDVEGAYEAVVGENLMKSAHSNGWAGILVNGYVRDTHVTSTIPVALWALGTCPRKSFEKNPARRGIDLDFGGIVLREGEWLFSDGDGIIVVQNGLARTLSGKKR